MTAYAPVPVEAARFIADTYAKSVVIVLAWDPVHGQLHTTTYGVDDQSKAWAADGGEIASKALGTMPNQATYFENYRGHCCVASGHAKILPEKADGVSVWCVEHPQEAP